MQQPPRFELIADRRAIIDRRAVTERLSALPDRGLQRAATAILKEALEAGRTEIARRLTAEPGRGRVIAASYSFLADQLVRLVHDLVVQRLYPIANPSSGERIAIAGSLLWAATPLSCPPKPP